MRVDCDTTSPTTIVGFHPRLEVGYEFFLCIYSGITQPDVKLPSPEQFIDIYSRTTHVYGFNSVVEPADISNCPILNKWAVSVGPNDEGIDEGIYVLIHGKCKDHVPATIEFTYQWSIDQVTYSVKEVVHNRSPSAVIRDDYTLKKNFLIALLLSCMNLEPSTGTAWRRLVSDIVRRQSGTQRIMHVYEWY